MKPTKILCWLKPIDQLKKTNLFVYIIKKIVVVSFVRFMTHMCLKNIVLEIPTEHGKTFIIAIFALIISNNLAQLVLVVSMNLFLS